MPSRAIGIEVHHLVRAWFQSLHRKRTSCCDNPFIPSESNPTRMHGADCFWLLPFGDAEAVPLHFEELNAHGRNPKQARKLTLICHRSSNSSLSRQKLSSWFTVFTFFLRPGEPGGNLIRVSVASFFAKNFAISNTCDAFFRNQLTTVSHMERWFGKLWLKTRDDRSGLSSVAWGVSSGWSALVFEHWFLLSLFSVGFPHLRFVVGRIAINGWTWKAFVQTKSSDALTKQFEWPFSCGKNLAHENPFQLFYGDSAWLQLEHWWICLLLLALIPLVFCGFIILAFYTVIAT